MKFLFYVSIFFLSSCLATNPSKNIVDGQVNDSNLLSTTCEQETKKAIDELRELFRQQILNEKESSFIDFLKSLFLQLIKDLKSESATENISLDESAQKYFDDLISELEIKYDSEIKPEYTNEKVEPNSIEEKKSRACLIIESTFRESDEKDRQLIFNMLIDIYLNEYIKYVEAKTIEFKEINYLRQKTLQTIVKFDDTNSPDRLYDDSGRQLKELISTFSGVILEIKNINGEEKTKAIKKFKELQNGSFLSKMINSKKAEEQFLETVIPILKKIFVETVNCIAETENMLILNTIPKRLFYIMMIRKKMRVDCYGGIIYDIKEFNNFLSGAKKNKFMLELFSNNKK